MSKVGFQLQVLGNRRREVTFLLEYPFTVSMSDFRSSVPKCSLEGGGKLTSAASVSQMQNKVIIKLQDYGIVLRFSENFSKFRSRNH
jgi:hypothetical protein